MFKLACSMIFVSALITLSEGRDRGDVFTSTKATAAKMGGLPGRPCTPEGRKLVDGPCWDPPGAARAIPAATLAPGMRLVVPPNWKYQTTNAIYFFDIPREATPDPQGEGYALLPNIKGEEPHYYNPYAENEGFVQPPIPPLVGRTVTEVLAAIDALDMPFVVRLAYRDCKDVEHDRICEITSGDDKRSARLQLVVSQTIRYRGLPEEQRLSPEGADLEGQPTDQVVARLKKIGFTNVVVVEKDLPCKRDIVCRVPGRGGWHGTNQLYELWVREGKPL